MFLRPARGGQKSAHVPQNASTSQSRSRAARFAGIVCGLQSLFIWSELNIAQKTMTHAHSNLASFRHNCIAQLFRASVASWPPCKTVASRCNMLRLRYKLISSHESRRGQASRFRSSSPAARPLFSIRLSSPQFLPTRF